VRFASGLLSRIRQLSPEFARFCVVGTIAFVTADAGSNVLHFKLGVGPLTSNAISTVLATIIAFGGNRYWTFKGRERSGVSREGVLFFALNLVALLIQLACIGFTSYALGLTGKLPYNCALIAGIGLGMMFRFWSYRKWVWLAAPPAPASPPRAKPHVSA
jgi:putative flippase GtrA